LATAGSQTLRARDTASSAITGLSGPITVGATAAGASALVQSSANPSFVNQAVTFTVTLTGSETVPTGTATFFDNGSPIGVVALSGGIARSNVTFNSPGTHAITVAYSGDTNYAASTSGFTQTVSNT